MSWRNYLSRIQEELVKYGRADLLTWGRLKANLVDDRCENISRILSKLRGFIANYGSLYEELLFVADFCFGSCFDSCSSDYLEWLLERVWTIGDIYLRRYLLEGLIRASLLSGSRERALGLVRRGVAGEFSVSIPEVLWMVRGIAYYDLGLADDLYLLLLERIRGVESVFWRSVFLAQLAYFYASSFGDRSSVKFARDLLAESSELRKGYHLDFLRYLGYTLPYILSFDSGAKRDVLIDALVFAPVEKAYPAIRTFLDEGLFVLDSSSKYSWVLKWLERAHSRSRIRTDDYLTLYSRLIRGVGVLDPYIATHLYLEKRELFVRMGVDSVDPPADTLLVLASIDIELAYNLFLPILRETIKRDIVRGLSLLSELRDSFPRKLRELYKFEVRKKIKKLNVDTLAGLVGYIANINTEEAREDLSSILWRIDKIGNNTHKASLLIKAAENLSAVDKGRAEQLVLYAIELLEEPRKREDIELLGKAIKILTSIDETQASSIILHIIEDTDEERRALLTNTIVKNLGHIPKRSIRLEQIIAYIKEKS